MLILLNHLIFQSCSIMPDYTPHGNIKARSSSSSKGKARGTLKSNLGRQIILALLITCREKRGQNSHEMKKMAKRIKKKKKLIKNLPSYLVVVSNT